jgi:hypothetical protein
MSLYNSEQFGKNLRQWIGQIVDDSEWKENRPGEKYVKSSVINGWGYRYKVRIFGKHPESNLSDVELPFADVLYPITSGSGHGASFQTPNLRKGTYVYGVYLDGMDETQPLIIGCFGNNDQTKLQFSRSQKGFVPISGLYSEQVPIYAIPPGGSGPQTGDGSPYEGVGYDNRESEADKQAEKDGNEETALPISEKCAKSLDKTQTELKKFISRIEETQRRSQNWSYWVNAKGTELASGIFKTENIDIDIQRTSQFIAAEIKRIINGIRQYITEKIDNTLSDVYNNFFPEEEKELEKAHNEAISLITCLFNKIIANLLKMIGDLLKQIVGRFINVPLCAVENILAGILGQLLGLIIGTLQAILGTITSLIGIVIDIAGDILGFVGQILGFFICDEDSACPENTKWSLWGGGSSSTSLDFNNIFDNIKSISDSATQIVDPNTFDFNLDYSFIFDNSCNVGPIFCGPPIVEFYGGGGSGALGNAIIGASGDILGVDIISPGSGYSRSPFVRFIDNCGNGKGASGRVVIDDGEVVEVIMDNSGFNYLPDFDGSRGGDGRVFATSEQIVIQRSDGRFEIPIDPGEPFEVFDGDIVTGPFTPQQVKRSELNTNSKGEYDIVLSICRVEINSTGVNYSPEDTIVVEPDNGAILEPVFGPFGSIIDVNIANPGIGFTVRPNIYIKTETGYNAELIPILCVNRKGDIPEEEYKLPFGEKIIKVIDCVGKP